MNGGPFILPDFCWCCVSVTSLRRMTLSLWCTVGDVYVLYVASGMLDRQIIHLSSAALPYVYLMKEDWAQGRGHLLHLYLLHMKKNKMCYWWEECVSARQDLGLVQQLQAVFDFLGGGAEFRIDIDNCNFGSCILVLNYGPCLMLWRFIFMKS